MARAIGGCTQQPLLALFRASRLRGLRIHGYYDAILPALPPSAILIVILRSDEDLTMTDTIDREFVRLSGTQFGDEALTGRRPVRNVCLHSDAIKLPVSQILYQDGPSRQHCTDKCLWLRLVRKD